MGEGTVRPVVVVVLAEGVEQGLQFGEGAGCWVWARSHFFRVCWKRSTLPQVVGWFGLLFFCTIPRRRSSCSKPLRVPAPLRPWERRVVKTMPLSVRVEAGHPCRSTAVRNACRTMVPVTRWWAVQARTNREWSSMKVRTSVSVPSARRTWVKSVCQSSLGRSASKRM